jgi:predicted permease
VAIGDSGAIPLDYSQRELNRLAGRFFFEIEGRNVSNGESLAVDRLMVTPNYFHLLGISLLRGRFFDDFDDASKPEVAVVDEAFAQTYWPNEDAIGKRFRSTRAGSQWTTVVGVVANARTGSVAREDPPQVYVSLYQTGSHHLAIFLRGQLDQSSIARQVREQVQSVDSRLPVFGAQQLKETISASLEDRKFAMEMIGMFALVALLLAGIGIYGVISYMVSARTLEFGIRMALGAQKRDILMMVLRQGLALATVATAVGLVASVLVSEMMKGMLYGLTPTDPLTLISIAALVICIALASCYAPASRAVRVNPQVALKCD